MLSEDERRTVEGWAKRGKTAQVLAYRSRIILRCAEGLDNTAVAREMGCTRDTVGKWRNRFIDRRLDGLSDEARPGAPRTLIDAQVEEVVVRTLEEVPEGATHWSKREPAKRVGISASSVRRIWQAFGLAPHRVEEFKISTDPLHLPTGNGGRRVDGLPGGVLVDRFATRSLGGFAESMA